MCRRCSVGAHVTGLWERLPVRVSFGKRDRIPRERPGDSAGKWPVELLRWDEEEEIKRPA